MVIALILMLDWLNTIASQIPIVQHVIVALGKSYIPRSYPTKPQLMRERDKLNLTRVATDSKSC